MNRLAAVVAAWRERAALLAPYAPNVARALEDYSRELFEALSEQNDELLTLRQAEEESGYSADHLRRLIREEAIPNAGRKNAPRIRRGDLPRKVSVLRPEKGGLHLVGASKEQIARSVVNS
jgi:hypothetical protein